MANKRISEMPVMFSGINLSGMYVPILDTTEGDPSLRNKRISISYLVDPFSGRYTVSTNLLPSSDLAVSLGSDIVRFLSVNAQSANINELYIDGSKIISKTAGTLEITNNGNITFTGTTIRHKGNVVIDGTLTATLPAHTHSESSITDLDKYTKDEIDDLLDGKSDEGHSHPNPDWSNIQNKPINYPPLAHLHGWTDIQSKPEVFTPSTFLFIQETAMPVWTINHNLNRYVSVTVVDSSGSKVVGDIEYVDLNQVILRFNGTFAGKAYLI